MADPHDDGEYIENYGGDAKSSTPKEFPDRKPCADMGAERDAPAEPAFTRTKSDPIECHRKTRDQQRREHALPSPTARRQSHEGAAKDEYQARRNRDDPLSRESVCRMNRSIYGGADHHETDCGRDNTERDPSAERRAVGIGCCRLA